MLHSFKYAFRGIYDLVRNENNAHFHFLATILAVIAGFYLKLNYIEWSVIIILTGLVWSAEAFNSAIEKLCDFVSPEKREIIRKVKDMSAAGVLFLAIAAAIIALIIFIPKILNK
ncbi:diacylglycerol kinase family protein [Emticicia sp. CRIBPO]|uniref:diacylglycerol kinase family protein n=1 Tax=Emticicia sp. CRIBPO TaxID=2683258 RepID=UPI001E61F24A|nr:diacylglycerol kinase family protein [Emticicia sp. CRIBPO]